MKRAFAVFIDQVFSSASNFLLVLLIARTLPVEDFGVFAIAYSWLTFALGLTRASLGVPISTDLHRLPHDDQAAFIARSMAVGLTMAALTAILVGTLGVLMTDGPLTHAILLLALFSPFQVCQDLGRYVLIARGQPHQAALSDGLWALTTAIAFGWSLVVGPGGPVASTLWWITGGAIALGFVARVVRAPYWVGTWGWFTRDVRRWHLTGDAFLGAGTPLAVAMAVALISGPAVVGSIRGAATLMTPINVLIAAAGLGAVAEIARVSPRAGRRLTLQVTTAMVAIAAAWGALVLLLPDSVGVMLIGETWLSAAGVLPFVVGEFVALSVWTGAISLMRARGLTGPALLVRGVYSLLGVGLATGAAINMGTASAVQLAMTAAAASVAVMAWWIVWRHEERGS